MLRFFVRFFCWGHSARKVPVETKALRVGVILKKIMKRTLWRNHASFWLADCPTVSFKCIFTNAYTNANEFIWANIEGGGTHEQKSITSSEWPHKITKWWWRCYGRWSFTKTCCGDTILPLVYRVIKHHHGTMEQRVPPTQIHRKRHIICVRGLYFAFVPRKLE